MPLRLRLRICNDRGIAELLPELLERAVLPLLRDLGKEEQDGIQRAALQERRPAHIQDRRHALLNDHGRHLRGVIQHLYRHLDAQVRDVQVRVGDEGHYVADDLHHRLHRHAGSVLLHEMHQRVQALLPERAAVLAQVHREVPADGAEHAGQRQNVHLGDAHRLQGLDRGEARHLVLDAVHEGLQAARESSLELRQVTRAGHEVAEALQRALFDLLINVGGHQLPAQHVEDREHLRQLGAGLLRPWPERIHEGAHGTESLGYRLVVRVVAARQEERAQQRSQLLVDARIGKVLAEVPQADQGVEPHTGVGLLHGPDQLVLDLRKVRLDVLRHALRQDAQKREGTLPRLLRLGPQLLVQLRAALRQHGHQELSCRPLLRRRRALDLQDARHRSVAGGVQGLQGLALDDRCRGHLRECREHVELDALLALLEAGDQRRRKLRVDVLQLVRQAPHHGSEHLEGSPPDLPGVVVVVGIDEPIVVKLVEAVVHGIVSTIARVVEVGVVRDQVEDHFAQLVQVRRHLLGAAEHEGLECIQAVLNHLVVFLVVPVHGDVLLRGLVHNLEEQGRNVPEVLADAEADVPAHSADALDVLLLLGLRGRRAHVREEHLHEGIQLSVSEDGGECPDAGYHLLSQGGLVLLRLQEVQQGGLHVLLVRPLHDPVVPESLQEVVEDVRALLFHLDGRVGGDPVQHLGEHVLARQSAARGRQLSQQALQARRVDVAHLWLPLEHKLAQLGKNLTYLLLLKLADNLC
mmetsp:Transcript_8430/g.22916  ORF Transcript_8430/g.22916 Transcript_8430/m.22916 type:complete len:750 (+) Transcript_8430:1461-3710(+)